MRCIEIALQESEVPDDAPAERTRLKDDPLDRLRATGDSASIHRVAVAVAFEGHGTRP
jgi:hypothetical protein